MSAESVSVQLDGLSKRYGRIIACDDLSLGFSAGVIGLLGPNGAGKTSLMSMLSGDLRPDVGAIVIDGHQVLTVAGRRAVRGTIGYLPQRFDLAGGMRVVDVVRYAAWCNGVRRAELADAADRALRLAGLADKERARVRTVSGGQRQRLGMAASIVHYPRLLLLDEPTAGLDPEQRIRFRQLISTLASRATVLLATHLLEDVRHAADRLLVLDHGRVVFDGTPDDLAGRAPSDASSEPTSDLERGYRSVLSSSEAEGWE